MNVQDRIAEFILPIIDWAMNLIAFGMWSRWQGARVREIRAKE